MGNEWEIQNKRGSYGKFLLVDINKFLSSFCIYKLINDSLSYLALLEYFDKEPQRMAM